MGVIASVVVSTLSLVGGVALDGDTQGRGLLAWQTSRGELEVIQAVDVRDGQFAGRPRRLWRTRGQLALGGLDVAASGATVACLRMRDNDRTQAWRPAARAATAGPGVVGAGAGHRAGDLGRRRHVRRR
jgi:hypothetical protein